MNSRDPSPARSPATNVRAQRLLLLSLTVPIVVGMIVFLGRTSAPHVARQPGEILAGQRAAARLFAGIPQTGNVLGRPDAPVTIVELADLQCPFCARFAHDELPAVVRDEVRTGRARLELDLVDILDRGGTDSARLAAVAAAAGRHHRLFQVADIAFMNQGPEGSSWADDAFVRKLVSAVRGLPPRVTSAVHGASNAAAVRAARARFTALGARGTPTVLVGPTGGKLATVDADAGAIHRAVDRAAG